MNMSDQARRADDAAAEWLFRRDCGLSADDEAAFAEWLAASAVNTEAWARAERLWHDVGSEHDPLVNAMRVDALGARPGVRRQIERAAIGVAAALLFVFAGLLGWQALHGPSTPAGPVEIAANAPATYTADATRKTVTLPDGSSATLDVRSAIALNFTSGRRDLRLLRGQALFDVQHDAARPFAVQARDSVVTATGTVFAVRIDESGIRASLARGRVVVGRVGAADTVTLAPGQSVVSIPGKPMAVSASNSSIDFDWSAGYVEFSDTPLGDAVALMNRYATKPIRVSAAAARLRISGRFRIDDPQGFIAVVTQALPVRARRTSDGGTELVPR